MQVTDCLEHVCKVEAANAHWEGSHLSQVVIQFTALHKFLHNVCHLLSQATLFLVRGILFIIHIAHKAGVIELSYSSYLAAHLGFELFESGDA